MSVGTSPRFSSPTLNSETERTGSRLFLLELSSNLLVVGNGLSKDGEGVSRGGRSSVGGLPEVWVLGRSSVLEVLVVALVFPEEPDVGGLVVVLVLGRSADIGGLVEACVVFGGGVLLDGMSDCEVVVGRKGSEVISVPNESVLRGVVLGRVVVDKELTLVVVVVVYLLPLVGCVVTVVVFTGLV